MFWLALAVISLLMVTFFHLRGQDLSGYDTHCEQSFGTGREPSAELRAVEGTFLSSMGEMNKLSGKERLRQMREYMDGVSDDQDIDAEITPVDAGGVPAEWVLAPGADPRRKVLYIHGGAFVMGSPKSHRNITSRFSAIAEAAVLAIDYRLMPEHRRADGIEDCRSAYRWLLENGPGGEEQTVRVFVAGDSAGGNLTLSLLAWIRDAGLRAPDAAVALSPITDATFSGASVKENLATDAMLGPMFRRFMWLPGPALWWISWLQNRITPASPLVSPVYGDLTGLPPTLVHASEAEVLLDDARRYVNKATASGTPARLQTWEHVLHVWHMFYPQLPEAGEAWEQIQAFIAQVDAPVAEAAA